MSDSEFRRLCEQLIAFRNQRDSLTLQVDAMESAIEAEKNRRASLPDTDPHRSVTGCANFHNMERS